MQATSAAPCESHNPFSFAHSLPICMLTGRVTLCAARTWGQHNMYKRGPRSVLAKCHRPNLLSSIHAQQGDHVKQQT